MKNQERIVTLGFEETDLLSWKGQPAYTKKLLTEMGMADFKTPVNPNSHLMKATEEVVRLDQQVYQSLVESLVM